jgi:ubiquinone/menaquinone biosynthesis C-methylase UbiE
VPDRSQLDRVRERFTRTAQQFAKFSLTKRSEEAEQLVALAAPTGAERTLDLACGPGTFTCAFAPRVRRILGLDLTSALLAQAREATRQAGLTNIEFACGDATALPFRGGAFDLAVCGYSLHHFADAAAALAELARIVRGGGRLAIVDLIIPEGADAEAHNAIEIARDASHVRTLRAAEMRAMVEAAGLRLRAEKTTERLREFDDWMRIAGWGPGDAAYAETRRLLEATLADDRAGFHPRRAASPEGAGALQFIQVSHFVIADR